MLSQYLDITNEYYDPNSYGGARIVVIDVSNYDYVLVQPVNITGGTDIKILSTIDSGAITGISDGNASSAINFTPVLATRMTGNTDTDFIGEDSVFKMGVIGRYLKLDGSTSVTNVDKLLVMLTKIS